MRLILSFTLLLFSVITQAADLHIARAATSFPETMLKLQERLKVHGYTVSRVQRVDIGLTASGYKTDKYRVVFYGKPKEIEMLSNKYPQVTPYLPLKIAIFAENEETLLVASNPMFLSVSQVAELRPIFKRWEKDLEIIMREMQQTM